MSFAVSASTGLPGQLQMPPPGPAPTTSAPPLTAGQAPVAPAAASDTGNTASGGRDDSPRDPPPGRTPRVEGRATPYVALPTVDAETVAAEAARLEARARMAPPEAKDGAKDATEDRAKDRATEAPARLAPAESDPVARMSETAIERQENTARLSNVQPKPENAPSLEADTRALRTASSDLAQSSARPAAADRSPSPEAA